MYCKYYDSKERYCSLTTCNCPYISEIKPNCQVYKLNELKGLEIKVYKSLNIKKK